MTVRGTTQVLTATFRSWPGGPLVDPTDITLVITTEAGAPLTSVTEAGLTHDSTGMYHYAWDIPSDAAPGIYRAEWTATLPGNASPTVGYEIITVTQFAAPTPPAFGGCAWPMDPACANDQWGAYPPETQERALALASATLERLTGGRVGNCPVKVRPCTTAGAARFGCSARTGYWMYPVDWNGTWLNLVPQPSCTTPYEVTLPGPVGRVDEVRVDGQVLDPTTYRVQGNRLIWSGGSECPWSFVQDLTKDDTESGTFSVTYLNAYPVDSLGAYAVGVLALEYAKACSGDECELPENVRTISRQGLTLDVISGSFPGGETGLRPVDTFIALWNPGHLRGAPQVWSPDLPAPRQVV